VALLVNARGVKAEAIDTRELVLTDATFGDAVVQDSS
jgi:hypothetical protein